MEKFNATEQELLSVMKLADANMNMEETEIGFEFRSQFITNALCESSARFGLNLKQAVAYYGFDNVKTFYHDILANAGKITADQ